MPFLASQRDLKQSYSVGCFPARDSSTCTKGQGLDHTHKGCLVSSSGLSSFCESAAQDACLLEQARAEAAVDADLESVAKMDAALSTLRRGMRALTTATPTPTPTPAMHGALDEAERELRTVRARVVQRHQALKRASLTPAKLQAEVQLARAAEASLLDERRQRERRASQRALNASPSSAVTSPLLQSTVGAARAAWALHPEQAEAQGPLDELAQGPARSNGRGDACTADEANDLRLRCAALGAAEARARASLAASDKLNAQLRDELKAAHAAVRKATDAGLITPRGSHARLIGESAPLTRPQLQDRLDAARADALATQQKLAQTTAELNNLAAQLLSARRSEAAAVARAEVLEMRLAASTAETQWRVGAVDLLARLQKWGSRPDVEAQLPDPASLFDGARTNFPTSEQNERSWLGTLLSLLRDTTQLVAHAKTLAPPSVRTDAATAALQARLESATSADLGHRSKLVSLKQRHSRLLASSHARATLGLCFRGWLRFKLHAAAAAAAATAAAGAAADEQKIAREAQVAAVTAKLKEQEARLAEAKMQLDAATRRQRHVEAERQSDADETRRLRASLSTLLVELRHADTPMRRSDLGHVTAQLDNARAALALKETLHREAADQTRAAQLELRALRSRVEQSESLLLQYNQTCKRRLGFDPVARLNQPFAHAAAPHASQHALTLDSLALRSLGLTTPATNTAWQTSLSACSSACSSAGSSAAAATPQPRRTAPSLKQRRPHSASAATLYRTPPACPNAQTSTAQ